MSRSDLPEDAAGRAGGGNRRDDWGRRHAKTRPRTGPPVVRADAPEDDWARRHGRCR